LYITAGHSDKALHCFLSELIDVTSSPQQQLQCSLCEECFTLTLNINAQTSLTLPYIIQKQNK